MENNIYKCPICGNVMAGVRESGVSVMCCGMAMQKLIANTTDAAQEKHVPVLNVSENQVEVSVGSVEHPMTAEHFIEWVMLETNQGVQLKKLEPNNVPAAKFALAKDEKYIAVYAYCNLHGLWKA